MRFSPACLLAASIALSALSGACSNQSEGEVCDPQAPNGGNSDCQDGLVCTSPQQLAPGTLGYRCCPTDTAVATGACAFGQLGVTSTSAPPADGGSEDGEPTEEGGEQTETDGGPTIGDAAIDASDDASSDATSSDAAPASPDATSSSDAASLDAASLDAASLDAASGDAASGDAATE